MQYISGGLCFGRVPRLLIYNMLFVERIIFSSPLVVYYQKYKFTSKQFNSTYSQIKVRVYSRLIPWGAQSYPCGAENLPVAHTCHFFLGFCGMIWELRFERAYRLGWTPIVCSSTKAQKAHHFSNLSILRLQMKRLYSDQIGCSLSRGRTFCRDNHGSCCRILSASVDLLSDQLGHWLGAPHRALHCRLQSAGPWKALRLRVRI